MNPPPNRMRLSDMTRSRARPAVGADERDADQRERGRQEDFEGLVELGLEVRAWICVRSPNSPMKITNERRGDLFPTRGHLLQRRFASTLALFFGLGHEEQVQAAREGRATRRSGPSSARERASATIRRQPRWSSARSTRVTRRGATINGRARVLMITVATNVLSGSSRTNMRAKTPKNAPTVMSSIKAVRALPRRT